MEKIHDSVLDAIHAALSKESLVKKLVLPFNETLAAATKVLAILYYALLLFTAREYEGDSPDACKSLHI